jgi:putative PIN family toxin of toxin-antitoxin system
MPRAPVKATARSSNRRSVGNLDSSFWIVCGHGMIFRSRRPEFWQSRLSTELDRVSDAEGLRAVLDVNVFISALLSPHGAPAELLRAWIAGRFELIVSALLLAELGRALAYPKLRARIPTEDAARVVEWLEQTATLVRDPDVDVSPVRSVDPGDDYLLALAASQRALLVSGDAHLLALRDAAPVHSPSSFLALVVRAPKA